jgi:hypothetical protein
MRKSCTFKRTRDRGRLRRKENFMIDPVVETLVLDLLEWLSRDERTYEEVMDAWHTSCPKLSVWEEASDRALVTREARNGYSIVRIAPSGAKFVQQRRPSQRLEEGMEKAS